MGGILASWVAARRPDRVASLSLLSTSGTPSAKRRSYFAAITPETLPPGTQRLSAKWHGEPYWRDLARALFAYFAQTSGEHYPTRLAPPRALVVQANDDEILTRTDFEAWVERIDAPVQAVHAPGDHAFFADGRAGSRAANAALRHFLLSA
jgi:pimeloyl-ACP methyl ester carboxylesterase